MIQRQELKSSTSGVGPQIILDKSLNNAPYTIAPDADRLRSIFQTVGVPSIATDEVKVIFSRKARFRLNPFGTILGSFNNRRTIRVHTDYFYNQQHVAKDDNQRQRVQQELDLTVAHEAQHLKDQSTRSDVYQKQQNFDGKLSLAYTIGSGVLLQMLGAYDNWQNFLISIPADLGTGILFGALAYNIFYRKLPMEQAAFAKEEFLKRSGFYVNAAPMEPKKKN